MISMRLKSCIVLVWSTFLHLWFHLAFTVSLMTPLAATTLNDGWIPAAAQRKYGGIIGYPNGNLISASPKFNSKDREHGRSGAAGFRQGRGC